MMRINAFLCDKRDNSPITTAVITLDDADYRQLAEVIKKVAGKSLHIPGFLLNENVAAFAGGVAQIGIIKSWMLGRVNSLLESKGIKMFVSDYTIEHL